MSTDKRKFLRIKNSEAQCTLTINKTQYPVRLIDQSIDGLRVEGVPLLVFTNNVPLTIDVDGVSSSVICRNIQRIGDQEFALWLQRVERVANVMGDLKPQILINPYVSLNSIKLLCSPLASMDSKLRVELPGKKEFDVEMENIATRTRPERVEELQDPEHLEDLAGFYYAATGVQVDPNADSIVRFEFGAECPQVTYSPAVG